MPNLESLFPPHEAGLFLARNQHKSHYESVRQWEESLEALSGDQDIHPLDFGWVSMAQRRRAIETDSVWGLNWYHDTPVGFIRLFACDLDVLLGFARKEKLR
jgi:hypothetical protein